jgi:hypothetical protein
MEPLQMIEINKLASHACREVNTNLTDDELPKSKKNTIAY